MKKHLYLFLFFLIGLSSCGPRQVFKSYDKPKIQRLYSESIGDAAKPQSWEISNELLEIKKSNAQLIWKEIKGESYLLVSSWQTKVEYYKNDPTTGFYNTSKYPIWVTVAPELQNLCQTKTFGRKEGLDLRLKQLLGLPPNTEQKYFVEFWVRPQDLFRPCPDSDISDNTCDLAFPEGTSEDYKEWINDLRIASYYHPEWDKNYPWTQLGYTYDWHSKNKNHVGLSEFIIGKNANVVVKDISETAEYCALQTK